MTDIEIKHDCEDKKTKDVDVTDKRLTAAGSQQRGFTLIELMIVIVVVAILLAVALPAYNRQVMKGHRAAAQSEMLEIANREQQFLLANRSYASKATLEASGYGLPTDVAAKYSYTIALGAGTVPTYTVTFTPSGSQASDGNLTINSQGVKTPADKWK